MLREFTIREKIGARAAVRQIVRLGFKKPAIDLMCNECGKLATEYHHYKGYEKLNWLDVIPLCREHHGETSGYSIGNDVMGKFAAVRFTKTEFRFMRLLIENIGELVSHAEIAEQVGGITLDDPGGYSRPLALRVRKKVGKEHIELARGEGYYFMP